MQAGRFDKHSVDAVVDEFQKYLKDFCSSEIVFWVGDRLDSFWYNQLARSKYRLLWKVAKTTLMLSHGQASVEAGFLVNE